MDEAYCAEGYVPVKNADGTYGVDEADDYVAEVGGLYYKTLAEAVVAAQSGETVTLIKNASGDGIALMAADAKTVTIDLNSNTYEVDGNLVGSTNTKSQAFHFEEGNTVTIKNGTLTSDEARMFMQNYADLTLDNVTLDGTQMPGTGRYVLSNNSGNVVLKDTAIKAKNGDFAMDTCKYGNYAAPKVTVEGKSTINGDVELSGGDLALNNGALLGELKICGETLTGKVTKEDNFYAEAPESYEWVNGVLTNVDDGTVARNITTEKTYTTLTAALAEAKSGETVELLKDIDGEAFVTVFTGVTLDLNGHSIIGARLFYVTGQVSDSAAIEDRGIISASGYMFDPDTQKFTPVYDASADGYRLFNMAFSNGNTKVLPDGKLQFTLGPNGGERDAAYALLTANTKYNDRFKVVITFKWSTENETIEQSFNYKQSFIDQVKNDPSHYAFAAKVNGLTGAATAQPKYVICDADGNTMYTLTGYTFETSDGIAWTRQ